MSRTFQPPGKAPQILLHPGIKGMMKFKAGITLPLDEKKKEETSSLSTKYLFQPNLT